MKRVDRLLQDWRIRQAARWIPDGARVLDVGCFDGRLFRRLGDRLGSGVGIDPVGPELASNSQFAFLREPFPSANVPGGPFDVITMLAVLEHVEPDELVEWSRAVHELLAPGALLVATVPSPAVDGILDVLVRLRVLDGMEVEQHHGAEPQAIVDTFTRGGFAVVASKRFQLGLNNLIVLRRPDTLPPDHRRDDLSANHLRRGQPSSS